MTDSAETGAKRGDDHGEGHRDRTRGPDDHADEPGDHDHEHGPGDHERARDDHGHTPGDHSHDGHGHHDRDGHGHHDHDLSEASVAVVTVSSSRSLDDDPAGDAIEESMTGAGHAVALRELVADDFDGIQGTVNRLVNREDVDAVVTTGGTGVTPDDVTVEAVAPLLEKELPGFGELFRRLSYDDIGTRVVGTRAEAGVADGVPVFCLPGSENAARLGAEEIIAAEVGHLAGLARRDD